MYTDIRDLFDGNTELTLKINKLFNEKWDVVMTELAEPVYEALAVVYQDWLNTFLDAVPYEVFFIEEGVETPIEIVNHPHGHVEIDLEDGERPILGTPEGSTIDRRPSLSVRKPPQ